MVTCRHVITQAGGQRIIGDQNTEAERGRTAINLKLKAKEGNGLRDYRLELSDARGIRRWRTFLRAENVWDVAVIELDRESLSLFDIRPWRTEEWLPLGASLIPGAEVVVLTYPENYGTEPAPYDAHMEIDIEEHQISASDRAAIATKPLYHGASGSPVYRMIGNAAGGTADAEMRLQLVGVFTGALPLENPTAGHFHYIDTVGEIMAARRDALDESGANFRR